MIDYGMNPQEAGDAARMNHTGPPANWGMVKIIY